MHYYLFKSLFYSGSAEKYEMQKEWIVVYWNAHNNCALIVRIKLSQHGVSHCAVHSCPHALHRPEQETEYYEQCWCGHFGHKPGVCVCVCVCTCVCVCACVCACMRVHVRAWRKFCTVYSDIEMSLALFWLAILTSQLLLSIWGLFTWAKARLKVRQKIDTQQVGQHLFFPLAGLWTWCAKLPNVF